MTGGEIGAIHFSLRNRGYDREQVRWTLAFIADLRDRGFAPADHVPRGGFRSDWLRGYDREAVDRVFAGLVSDAAAAGLRVLPISVDGARADDADRPQSRSGAAWQQYESDCQAEWQRMDDLPGARLRIIETKPTGYSSQITGNAGEVLLTRRGGTTTLATGQLLRIDSQSFDSSTTPKPEKPLGSLLADSATGEPVLWLRGIHGNWKAEGYVLLPGQRFLMFPVRGTTWRNAVMTAVTESGSILLWFRRISSGLTEVVVSPDCDVTTEVLAVAEYTGGWVYSYFRDPLSGG